MLLRNSPHKGATAFPLVLEMTQDALGSDPRGYRAELVGLVRKAQALAGQ